ncbi:hypothetical protein ACFE04_025077 [Oxalis oulophora]
MQQLQAFLVVGRLPITITNTSNHHPFNLRRQFIRASSSSSYAINGDQNHYSVLGISHSATSADIKKAYRLLARKYHPDVSKDSQATKVFLTIQRAYQVLSNETTRIQYDRALTFQNEIGRSYNTKWHSSEYEDIQRTHNRWAEMRQRMQEQKYRNYYDDSSENFSSYGESYEADKDEKNRGPFSEVLVPAFVSLFILYCFGSGWSLAFSTWNAFLDHNLDSGYKFGYMIAWILGGNAGILLTMCLSFASWLHGKSSSGIVALVVVAMWVGLKLARYCPLPQGALLTLLYMSIKLQIDLN